MFHFPFVWFWKIGITSKSANKRAKSIDRAVIGFPVPVFILVIPGAYFVEQDLHRHFLFLSARFYKGDGSSEWFWFPVAPIVFALMCAGWIGYLWAFDLCFGTDFHTMAIKFVAGLFVLCFF